MCDDELSTLRFLPRNLSYVEDSHLSERSVTAGRFCCYRPKLERRADIPAMTEANSEAAPAGPERRADGVIEGIYINVMDDDHLGPPGTDVEEGSSGSGTAATTSKRSEQSVDELCCGISPIARFTEEEEEGKDEGQSPARADLVARTQSLLSETRQGRPFTNLLSPDSPVFQESEFNFSRAELRKSSSLKTNKTPPGTPGRKKVVRFADAMGLDLESVVHVLNMDAPPKIPPSALADLKSGIETSRMAVGTRLLAACFSQPSAHEDFMQRVYSHKVCLENAVISGLTITGIIRVANVAFHKLVRVRYTTNNWATFHDVAASYVQGSCDGPTDRFSFSIVAPANFTINSRLEFAISYTISSAVYWDSNRGENYAFECYARSGVTEMEDTWLHFL